MIHRGEKVTYGISESESASIAENIHHVGISVIAGPKKSKRGIDEEYIYYGLEAAVEMKDD